MEKKQNNDFFTGSLFILEEEEIYNQRLELLETIKKYCDEIEFSMMPSLSQDITKDGMFMPEHIWVSFPEYVEQYIGFKLRIEIVLLTILRLNLGVKEIPGSKYIRDYVCTRFIHDVFYPENLKKNLPPEPYRDQYRILKKKILYNKRICLKKIIENLEKIINKEEKKAKAYFEKRDKIIDNK